MTDEGGHEHAGHGCEHVAAFFADRRGPTFGAFLDARERFLAQLRRQADVARLEAAWRAPAGPGELDDEVVSP